VHVAPHKPHQPWFSSNLEWSGRGRRGREGWGTHPPVKLVVKSFFSLPLTWYLCYVCYFVLSLLILDYFFSLSLLPMPVWLFVAWICRSITGYVDDKKVRISNSSIYGSDSWIYKFIFNYCFKFCITTSIFVV
jgi:hypothetical protein